MLHDIYKLFKTANQVILPSIKEALAQSTIYSKDSTGKVSIVTASNEDRDLLSNSITDDSVQIV